MQKLYVIVRDDLTPAQKAVQAGHALAALLLKHKDTEWNNGTLVYLKVKNKIALLNIMTHMWGMPNPHAPFFEPDLGNEITAIACLGQNRVVKKLPLLV